MNRREFVEIAGAGLLIVATAPLSDAQRGGGAGAGTLETRLHVGEDGFVTILSGKIEEGQGALTELAMAAAEELRVPLSRVRMVMGDTGQTPNDGGTAGSGTSVAHTYTKAGTYTVVATASDGLAQVQSTYAITVTERPSTATTPVNTAAGGSATTSTISSSAFGTIFGLTVAHACLRPGASFTVTLGIKQRRSKSSASTLRKVTKVVFTAGGKSPKTARRSPFSAQLTVPSLASGASFKVSAVAHLVLRNGRHHVKSVAAVIKVC